MRVKRTSVHEPEVMQCLPCSLSILQLELDQCTRRAHTKVCNSVVIWGISCNHCHSSHLTFMSGFTGLSQMPVPCIPPAAPCQYPIPVQVWHAPDSVNVSGLIIASMPGQVQSVLSAPVPLPGTVDGMHGT